MLDCQSDPFCVEFERRRWRVSVQNLIYRLVQIFADTTRVLRIVRWHVDRLSMGRHVVYHHRVLVARTQEQCCVPIAH